MLASEEFRKEIEKIAEKLNVSFKGYNKEHIFIFNDKQYYFTVKVYMDDNLVLKHKLEFKLFNSYRYEFIFEVDFIKGTGYVSKDGVYYKDLVEFLGFKMPENWI